MKRLLNRISIWLYRKMTPPGFLEIYDNLNRINHKDPNNWMEISHLYHRLVNGHGVCATYGNLNDRKFHCTAMGIYDDLKREYREGWYKHVQTKDL